METTALLTLFALHSTDGAVRSFRALTVIFVASYAIKGWAVFLDRDDIKRQSAEVFGTACGGPIKDYLVDWKLDHSQQWSHD